MLWTGFMGARPFALAHNSVRHPMCISHNCGCRSNVQNLRKQNGLVFFLCDIPQTITMIICGLFTKNLKRVASKQGTPPSVYPQDALESELIRFRSGVARFRRNLRHPPHRALYSAPDQHPPPNRLQSPFLSCSVSGAFY